MSYVVSRLVNSNIYAIYKKLPSGVNAIVKSIKINGKADVINKKTLITEKGAITCVSEEDLELLLNNPVFLKQKANGVVDVVKSENDAKKVIKDETLLKDFSAPLTAEDMGDVKVVVENQTQEEDVDEKIAEMVKSQQRNRDTRRNKNKDKE